MVGSRHQCLHPKGRVANLPPIQPHAGPRNVRGNLKAARLKREQALPSLRKNTCKNRRILCFIEHTLRVKPQHLLKGLHPLALFSPPKIRHRQKHSSLQQGIIILNPLQVLLEPRNPAAQRRDGLPKTHALKVAFTLLQLPQSASVIPLTATTAGPLFRGALPPGKFTLNHSKSASVRQLALEGTRHRLPRRLRDRVIRERHDRKNHQSRFCFDTRSSAQGRCDHPHNIFIHLDSLSTSQASA